MSETLNEFLKRKTSNGFQYEITLDAVMFHFDTVPAGELWSAITLSDNAEFEQFHELLNNRKVILAGNRVENMAECRAITIKEYRLK